MNDTIKYLTSENVSFGSTDSGLITADTDKSGEYKRVYLSRAFPHDLTEEFISVSDSEGNELGIIRALSDFDSETADKLRAELERKYFSAKIRKIIAVEEKFGSSVWTVDTRSGMRVMTLQDTFKSIVRIGDDRALIIDSDGNRYEIESLSALDKHSFRRIELYL